MAAPEAHQRKDWVSNTRSYALAWGFPTAALIVAVFMGSPARTVIWASALAWMGMACIANAVRCGRRHCYLTGPFFLIMAGVAVVHGTGLVWLGPHGWTWLGVTIVVGGYGLLWLLPERIWGKFIDPPQNTK